MMSKFFSEWINKRIPPSNTITLKQNQIYIFPSRFGFLYMFFCVILLLLAINFQNSLVYILCFWLISLFIITIFKTWLNLIGIHIRAGSVEPIFFGERAEFHIIVESLKHEHRAIWLSTKESITSVDCLAHTNVETSLFVTPHRRGLVELPRFRLETTYPFGILRSWSYVDLNQQVICYPRPIESSLPESATIESYDDSNADSHSNIRGVDHFEGLKNYQVGDSVNRISWHAYAKGHGLFVKEFTGQGQKELWLDYQEFQGDKETKLSNLCYWALKLHDEKQLFGLKLGSREITPNTGHTHLLQCLEALAFFR